MTTSGLLQNTCLFVQVETQINSPSSSEVSSHYLANRKF